MELPFDRLLKVCANDLIDETLWSELDQFQHNGEKVQVQLGLKTCVCPHAFLARRFGGFSWYRRTTNEVHE